VARPRSHIRLFRASRVARPETPGCPRSTPARSPRTPMEPSSSRAAPIPQRPRFVELHAHFGAISFSAVLNNFWPFFPVRSPVVRHAARVAGAAIHQGMESGIAKTFDHRAGRQGQLWFAGQAEKGGQNFGQEPIPKIRGRVVCHTLIEWPWHPETETDFYSIRRRYAKDCWRRPRPREPGYSPAAQTPVSIPFHLSFMKGHYPVLWPAITARPT